MSYKKIYMSFNIKRHIHARVIFRCERPTATQQHTHILVREQMVVACCHGYKTSV